MPTRKRITFFGPEPDLGEGMVDARPETHVQHWTRKEQIANAVESGTLDEMRPPLTEKEKTRL